MNQFPTTIEGARALLLGAVRTFDRAFWDFSVMEINCAAGIYEDERAADLIRLQQSLWRMADEFATFRASVFDLTGATPYAQPDIENSEFRPGL